MTIKKMDDIIEGLERDILVLWEKLLQEFRFLKQEIRVKKEAMKQEIE